MKDEAWLSRTIRERLPAFGFRITSFEDAKRVGVPDLYVTTRSRSAFWLELKVIASTRSKIPFRKGQPGWIEDHANAGGVAFVIVLSPQSLFVLSGERCRSLASKKLGDAGNEILACLPVSGPDLWETLAGTLLAVPYGRESMVYSGLRKGGRSL